MYIELRMRFSDQVMYPKPLLLLCNHARPPQCYIHCPISADPPPPLPFLPLPDRGWQVTRLEAQCADRAQLEQQLEGLRAEVADRQDLLAQLEAFRAQAQATDQERDRNAIWSRYASDLTAQLQQAPCTPSLSHLLGMLYSAAYRPSPWHGTFST